jgi:sugar phosphate isomerase/epimerase
LDSAEALGAKRVRLWAGEKDFEDADTAYLDAVTTRAREIGNLAESRGLSIDLEFHRGTLNNAAAMSKKLLGAIRHANVHTLWQPPVELSFKERRTSLRELLPHVSNIHCFHWGPGGFEDRLPLASGGSEWSAYISELMGTGQSRWISLEYVVDDSFESLKEDACTLAELLGR